MERLVTRMIRKAMLVALFALAGCSATAPERSGAATDSKNAAAIDSASTKELPVKASPKSGTEESSGVAPGHEPVSEKDVVAAKELHAEAIELAKQHKYSDAIKIMKKAEELNPVDPVISFDLGRLYRYMGLNTDAIECFSRTLTMNITDDNRMFIYNEIGAASISAGNAEQGISYFKKGLEIDPHSPRFMMLLSDAYYHLNNYESFMKYADMFRRETKNRNPALLTDKNKEEIKNGLAHLEYLQRDLESKRKK